LLSTRFFRLSDARSDTFVFPLPKTWWSRPYEYEWCARFIGRDAVALDAACGISHPFKFELVSRCKEAHACDLDERILSDEDVYEDVERDFGRAAAAQAKEGAYLSGLRRAHANLTALPYGAGVFDTIFCISVLEHMSVPEQAAALSEFRRALKPDGQVVLTFDYPTVDPGRLRRLAADAGFAFAGSEDDRLPEDAVSSDLWGRLYCYRAVLRVRRAGQS